MSAFYASLSASVLDEIGVINVQTDVLFWLLAAMTGVCALAVVVTQNIVRAATWLLFTLAGTAGIFFLLGADFVGATQLLVYVGGTLVLVVFGVMLTAQGPFINMKIGAAEWAIAMAGRAAALRRAGRQSASGQPDRRRRDAGRRRRRAAQTAPTARPRRSRCSANRQASPTRHVTGMCRDCQAARDSANRMAYLLPFEIVSVHLLVVLIGAAYLARAKRRRPERAAP